MSDSQETPSVRDASPDRGEARDDDEADQSNGNDATLEEEGTELVSRPRHNPDVASETRSLDADDGPDGLDTEVEDQPEAPVTPQRAASPSGSLASGPDRSPSVPGSLLSSPGSSVLPSVASRPGLGSPTPSFRPFDRRFQSRITSSALNSPRPSSPAFVSAHSRNVSLATTGFPTDQTEADTPTPPWEVVRWTRLRKLSGNAFSELGRRNLGSPTCLSVSASIVLGTFKGIILLFDYSQNLKMIIGQGTKAVEAGPVTSVAVSADHSTIAGGHSNGSIFTWDTSRAARPFLSIPPLDDARAEDRVADGHAPNAPVLHLGFLGTRHTALVSADDRGMAFSHLASRGAGPLGRTVKTTRILGRYPGAPQPPGKHLKPSTVLAFAPLPLGNVERGADVMGLTAMLTPYLLVIVSTTPVGQTQHKSARPKEVPAHSAMSGCLSWFPAVKLKTPDASSGSDISLVKLAYCWSSVLTVLDMHEVAGLNKDQPPTLRFRARSRWKCEEAIVAVQWLTRSVLAVLTISQRLIVLEDRSMRMTEAFDLLPKHIYHVDLFSTQLEPLVEQLDEQDQAMHGVVADAFYMSFKAYKSRIFLLSFNEVSIGVLSNWADGLIAMMEHGDYIGAIRLATSYYTGDADKLTIGLPEDAQVRHAMVRDKVMEIISASLKYAFGQRQKSSDEADDAHMRQLVEVCFTACLAVGSIDYLTEDLYEWYESANLQVMFYETLEPYILDETITIVPPAVVKDLVNQYVARGLEARLEEMICHMQTTTLDLDQMTSLCKQHGLYDALTYIWNQALGDYVGPAIDLLGLLVPLTANGDHGLEETDQDYYQVNALKIFPYLSYALTGRVYPSGEAMDENAAVSAKSGLYWLFFSGKTVEWPKGSGREFLTRPSDEDEPAFPYLRLILKFDAPSFLSALNEAFEDPFLNDSPDRQPTGVDMPEEQIFGLTINRQFILTILLDVMSPENFAPEDTIYLDMFLARNLSKFPQYLLFSGSTLSKALANLCTYPGEDLADDAQLSAEYLLSAYQPPDMAVLLPLFREAGFYRILKRTYRVEKQYGKLIEMYFEDADHQEAVFDCISECLDPHAALDDRQLEEVHRVVDRHAMSLLHLSPDRTAAALATEPPAVHQHILDSAHDQPELQHAYLRALLEPKEPVALPTEAEHGESPAGRQFVELYVQLMCKFDPRYVSEYVGSVKSADLRLDKVLPTMEATGVVDAAVVLMAREGQVEKAIERLIRHLYTLDAAIQGLLSGAEGKGGAGQGKVEDEALDVRTSVEELLRNLQRYVYVGIMLCQEQTKTRKATSAVQKRRDASDADQLSPDEQLWLSLIDACVQVTKGLSPAMQNLVSSEESDEDGKLLPILRSLVQHTFTSLLNTTSSREDKASSAETQPESDAGSNLSFLRVMRCFLARAASSSPNLADLRGVLASIFSAYAYEESILRLSNRLLERSLFVSVKQAVNLRQRGWRPRGSMCEACGRRAWGPGIPGGAILEAWEERQAVEEAAKLERKARAIARAKGNASELDARDKGKSRDTQRTGTAAAGAGAGAGADADVGAETSDPASRDGPMLGPLVVLACRHMYHKSCLETLQGKREAGEAGPTREREYRCPIDG